MTFAQSQKAARYSSRECLPPLKSKTEAEQSSQPSLIWQTKKAERVRAWEINLDGLETKSEGDADKEHRRGGGPEGNKVFSMLFFVILLHYSLATLVQLDQIAKNGNKLLGVIDDCYWLLKGLSLCAGSASCYYLFIFWNLFILSFYIVEKIFKTAKVMLLPDFCTTYHVHPLF